MEFSIFDAFEKEGAVGIDPLADQVSRFVLVGSVVGEKQVSVSMKDQGLESVKDGEFPEGLFFEKAGTLAIVYSVSCLISLFP